MWRSDDLIALGRAADAVRKRLCPEGIVSYAITPDEAIVEHIFGQSDSIEQRLDTLDKLRQRQQERGDILAFRPLVETAATGVEYLKALSLSRLYLDNVPHVQGSWKLFGPKVAQLSLRFGADDLGSVQGEPSAEEVRRLIRDAGFVPKQRDALFRTYSIA